MREARWSTDGVEVLQTMGTATFPQLDLPIALQLWDAPVITKPWRKKVFFPARSAFGTKDIRKTRMRKT